MFIYPFKISKIKASALSLFRILEALVYTTHRKRWSKVAKSGLPPWDARNRKIADLIPAGSSVIDMGCGAQTLRGYLPSKCTYQPCDVVKSTPDIIQVDFNRGQFPTLGERYSHVVISGVFEYIRNVEKFLSECTALGETLILSYNTRPTGQSKLERMANHWVNHFTQFELEELFRRAGLGGECVNYQVNGEVIYRLQSKATPNFVHQENDQRSDLRIDIPILEVTGEEARLNVKVIASDGVLRELWYSLPAAYKDWFATDRCDGFVVGLLLQAMERNENILTASPISSLLWHNLTQFYIPMMARAFPHLHPIKIIPVALTTAVKPAHGVATGFSAGIDSFSTFMQHYVHEAAPELRITHLMFHNVGSHNTSGCDEDDQLLFKQRNGYLKPFSDDVGIPFVPVNSNLSKVFPIDFIKTHHALNASVLLVLQNQFRRYFFASTYPYESCGVGQTDDIGRFDPMAFHLFSTETLSCVSTGCQLTRTEKTEQVATYEPSYRYLNVCASSSGQGQNCSVCFKCCRTILTLDLLGQAHNYRQVFDLNKFAAVRHRYMLKILFYKPKSFEKEIARLYLEKGRGPWVVAIALRRILDRLLGRTW